MSVVYLEDHQCNMTQPHPHVPPKSESRMHRAHRYTVRFDPGAPEHMRWTWSVSYTRKYTFHGHAHTIDSAASAARRRIDELVARDADHS